MREVRVHIAVSADGYLAGRIRAWRTRSAKAGRTSTTGWSQLKAWREPHGLAGGEVNASTPVVEESLANVGAEIMGRGKFGGGPGPRGDDPWRGKDVVIGGGASAINEYLAAGLVDVLESNIVPLVRGGGARLFEGVGPGLKLEQVRAIDAPSVTHVKYGVGRWDGWRPLR
jgi:hypothetical protein